MCTHKRTHTHNLIMSHHVLYCRGKLQRQLCRFRFFQLPPVNTPNLFCQLSFANACHCSFYDHDGFLNLHVKLGDQICCFSFLFLFPVGLLSERHILDYPQWNVQSHFRILHFSRWCVGVWPCAFFIKTPVIISLSGSFQPSKAALSLPVIASHLDAIRLDLALFSLTLSLSLSLSHSLQSLVYMAFPFSLSSLTLSFSHSFFIFLLSLSIFLSLSLIL